MPGGRRRLGHSAGLPFGHWGLSDASQRRPRSQGQQRQTPARSSVHLAGADPVQHRRSAPCGVKGRAGQLSKGRAGQSVSWLGFDMAGRGMARRGMDPNLRTLLRQTAKAGWQVEHFAAPDACPVCRTLAGRRVDPADAPIIPVAECENEFCRCDYLPVSG